MKKEDIINLAKECGLLIDSNDRLSTSRETSFHVDSCYFNIERFAALISAAEREKCAQVCDVLAAHPEFASDVTKLAAMAIRSRGSHAP